MNRFILIDDDELINYIHRQVIYSVAPDADIVEKTSSSEALEYLKVLSSNKNPDDRYFIFIDINMPEMNGFELLEKIGPMIPQEKACAFFVVSSSLFSSDREKAFSFPFVSGYREKPLSKQDIREILQQPM